jgi:hypothetical protein
MTASLETFFSCVFSADATPGFPDLPFKLNQTDASTTNRRFCHVFILLAKGEEMEY